MARLHNYYKETVIQELMKKYNYSSVMAVPKLEKIVVNMGVGKAFENKKLLDNAMDELTVITGQKAVKSAAKKSIAGFKIRKGMSIGTYVTLRGAYMYEFFDRLVNIALPRVRDFRGISPKGFDGRGNYNLGIKEQIIFPEIKYDKVETVRGMDISFVTTAATDDEGRELLRLLGMPFWKS